MTAGMFFGWILVAAVLIWGKTDWFRRAGPASCLALASLLFVCIWTYIEASVSAARPVPGWVLYLNFGLAAIILTGMMRMYLSKGKGDSEPA